MAAKVHYRHTGPAGRVAWCNLSRTAVPLLTGDRGQVTCKRCLSMLPPEPRTLLDLYADGLLDPGSGRSGDGVVVDLRVWLVNHPRRPSPAAPLSGWR